MIKKSNGITLISLIITIVVMLIISSVTVSISLDRFEINNYNKMISDLEFLEEKVLNYYTRYNEIPIIKEIEYTNINFEVDANDNGKYYIIDLKAMDNIALNYGKEGFENLNSSDDVYIINEKTHNIYYVKGIEWNEEYHHSIQNNANEREDNIPPTTPEIKVISGTKNEEGIYTSEVEIEIIPGKDNWSGVQKTTYSINNEREIEITDFENNILELTQEGEYTVKAQTEDNNQNKSDIQQITFKIEKKFFVKDVQGQILNENENTEVYDEFNNKMILPAGFMITEDADDVTKGIVVTDGTNEFVWIPVGEEITNESKIAKVELGRYYINDAKEFVNGGTNIIKSYYTEQTSSSVNTVALNLNNGFLKSVDQYGGYYIARYEARNGNDGKIVSRKDFGVCNSITQDEAAQFSRKMYLNKPFKSDLTNSYAWDTSIIFIQTFGKNKEDYANQKSYNSGYSSSGTTEDIACNIFDMASNCSEWTTETCSLSGLGCTFRGGTFKYEYKAGDRAGLKKDNKVDYISFRPILYIDPQN